MEDKRRKQAAEAETAVGGTTDDAAGTPPAATPLAVDAAGAAGVAGAVAAAGAADSSNVPLFSDAASLCEAFYHIKPTPEAAIAQRCLRLRGWSGIVPALGSHSTHRPAPASLAGLGRAYAPWSAASRRIHPRAAGGAVRGAV